jgi:hypothetical protein
VWYNGSTSHWSVFNEDVTTMNSAETFNVLVFPRPGSLGLGDASNISVATSSSATVAGDYMDLPNSVLSQFVLVTPNWNPPGNCCTYHNHNLGVWFNSWAGHWSVFNQDLATMPVGVSFNVIVMAGVVG